MLADSGPADLHRPSSNGKGGVKFLEFTSHIKGLDQRPNILVHRRMTNAYQRRFQQNVRCGMKASKRFNRRLRQLLRFFGRRCGRVKAAPAENKGGVSEERGWDARQRIKRRLGWLSVPILEFVDSWLLGCFPEASPSYGVCQATEKRVRSFSSF
jgi:hypothetical protein